MNKSQLHNSRTFLKGRLARSWNAVKSWRRRLEAGHRVAMPPELLTLMSLTALERGFHLYRSDASDEEVIVFPGSGGSGL